MEFLERRTLVDTFASRHFQSTYGHVLLSSLQGSSFRPLQVRRIATLDFAWPLIFFWACHRRTSSLHRR